MRMEDGASVAGLLLAWYDVHRRSLPWRENRDPYRIWVSEVMLQQTRVETVLSYFNSFLERFPDIRTLADAELEEVLRAWQGLGYYRRARMLWTGSRQMIDAYGGMPRTYDALKSIRGIGTYTAGAVASIAFQERRAAVDGNAVRVFARMLRMQETADTGKGRKMIEEKAQEWVPEDRPGDFNQAVMDLGSMVCKVGKPLCSSCPLAQVCAACEAGDAGNYPVLSHDRPKTVVPCTVMIITSGRAVLMQKRTEGLLSDMWVFPMLEGQSMTAEETEAYIKEKLHLDCRIVREEGEARHVFTHRIWEMRLFSADVSRKNVDACRWADADEMEELPIPTAMKAAKKRARELLSRV